MNLMNEMQKKLDETNNISFTENGAKGFKSSGKKLLDLNASVASLRSCDEQSIISEFVDAYKENAELAWKWLFFARDVREGLGERRLFRIIIKKLAQRPNYHDELCQFIKYIPEYGRWDDLFVLLASDMPEIIQTTTLDLIHKQLSKDWYNMLKNRNISLLTKWLPSVQTKNPEKRNIVKKVRKSFDMNEKEYRRMLALCRKYLDVVEVKMCANQWKHIQYENVPSKANLLYKEAFLRHDFKRREDYLSDVEQGLAKINSTVCFPHDIVQKYMEEDSVCDYDPTLENMWKALPDFSAELGNTLVVADSSGSMCTRCGRNTDLTLLNICLGLAIYLAEHNSGQFKDKYITFSQKPRMVDLSRYDTLQEKIEHALKYHDISYTNIKAVFELILKVAIENNMEQEDLPKNILIISDLEFDGFGCYGDYVCGTDREQALFDHFKDLYKQSNYTMPRLIFWNLGSRSRTIPLQENELGMALVSGFSLNILDMVLSNKTDAYECLLEQLMSKRYSPISLHE